MMDAKPDELVSCQRCWAVTTKSLTAAHREWHQFHENLEKPTTEFGFWDTEGRWNATSQDW